MNKKQEALNKKKGNKFNGNDIHGDRHYKAQLHREMKPYRISSQKKDLYIDMPGGGQGIVKSPENTHTSSYFTK